MEKNEDTTRTSRNFKPQSLRVQPIRIFQAQPPGMMLSAHLISIEIEQRYGVNG
jgi:hypothetical protein